MDHESKCKKLDRVQLTSREPSPGDFTLDEQNPTFLRPEFLLLTLVITIIPC